MAGEDRGQIAYRYDRVETVIPPQFANEAHPWQDVTLAPVDNVYDLHGSPTEADLVVFFNGNQFMAVDELVATFRRQYHYSGTCRG